MRYVLCTYRRHNVPSALIVDMGVKKRFCMDCKVLMDAERVPAPGSRPNKALPSTRFRMIPR